MTYPPLIDSRVAGRSAQHLDCHPMIVGEEVGRRVSTPYKDHMETENPHVKVFEGGWIVGIDRKMLELRHGWGSGLPIRNTGSWNPELRCQNTHERFVLDLAIARIVFHS